MLLSVQFLTPTCIRQKIRAKDVDVFMEGKKKLIPGAYLEATDVSMYIQGKGPCNAARGKVVSEHYKVG